MSQALAAEEADLDLGLVQPTVVLGRVVNSRPVPEQTADSSPITIH